MTAIHGHRHLKVWLLCQSTLVANPRHMSGSTGPPCVRDANTRVADGIVSLRVTLLTAATPMPERGVEARPLQVRVPTLTRVGLQRGSPTEATREGRGWAAKR